MSKKQIYWRWKGKKIVCEGLEGKNNLYLFTLPSPDIFIQHMRVITKGTHSSQKLPYFVQPQYWEEMETKLDRLNNKRK